jgi:hypothetical protein
MSAADIEMNGASETDTPRLHQVGFHLVGPG